MHRLPRSIRLALWANAVIGGHASAAAAVQHATGEDERHLLTGDDLPVSGHPAGPGLAEWLDDLADRGIRGCQALLPVPGDLCGVPAGPVAAPAMDAGEAVLATAGLESQAWILVPQVEIFGSEWEPGAHVSWHSYRLASAPATWVDPADTEQRLQRALLDVTAALEDLDVAAAGPDQLARLAALRGARGVGDIPPGTSGRSVRLLERAIRLGPMIELATESEGATITSAQHDQRRNLLQELTSCLRIALMAATVPDR